jgi:hypothetical protein
MKKFKVGDKVRSAGKPSNKSGNGYLNYHSYPDMEFTIIADITGNSKQFTSWGGKYNISSPGLTNCGYVYGDEIVSSVITKEELTSKIKSLKEEITELNSKLDFMNEHKLEEYDADTFKAFSVLKLVDNKKLSTIDKAKLIAELIK